MTGLSPQAIVPPRTSCATQAPKSLRWVLMEGLLMPPSNTASLPSALLLVREVGCTGQNAASENISKLGRDETSDAHSGIHFGVPSTKAGYDEGLYGPGYWLFPTVARAVTAQTSDFFTLSPSLMATTAVPIPIAETRHSSHILYTFTCRCCCFTGRRDNLSPPSSRLTPPEKRPICDLPELLLSPSLLLLVEV